MKGRPILSALLAGALVLATLGAPALAAEPAETRQEAARHAAELAMSYGGADSVQYALWEDGEITLSGSVGTYSRTEDRALTEEDLYGIGSVSKMYITAAVLALCEEGELSLEDPVAQVLPGFTMADERYSQITVEMLLDHSAGFMGDSTRHAFLFNDTGQQATDELLERLSTQRLKADPGAYSVYSNDCFTLAELVVEAVSGQDLMDYVRERFLLPAGLEDTYAPGDAFDTSRLTKTYFSASDDRALPQDTVGIVGAGGLYATAEDLAAFGGLFCGENELLTDASWTSTGEELYAQGLWPADSRDDALAYGLGWDNVHMFPFGQSGIAAWVKGGDTLRYHAGLIVLPEAGKAVAVLSSGGLSTYNELAGAKMLVDALAEDGVEVDLSAALPEAQPAQMPEELRDYAGTYAALGSVATVSFQGNDLILTTAQLLGGQSQTFTYHDDGSFRDESGQIMVKVVTGENGRAYLYQKGYTDVPGLVPTGTANYAMERLEPNTTASQAALDAWAARGERVFLIVNEKCSSQLYLNGMFNAVNALPEAPGYAAGQDLVVDETHAVQYLQIPGTGSRNGADYTVTERDGVEYLQIGDYLCMDYAAAPALWAGTGAYTTIQPDGLARWYQVGDLAGQTLEVVLPESGSFTVYDQNGQPVASSWVWGDTSVVLPQGGWIVFAGDPGARFYLTSRTA